MTHTKTTKGSHKRQPTSRAIEARALYFGASVLVVTAAIALLIFWGKQVPIFGLPSIGSIGSIFAGIAALVGFLTAYLSTPRHLESEKHSGVLRKWLKRAALAFAHAAIFFLYGVVIFFVVQQAFVGLTLDQWSSALIVGTVSGLSSYCAYLMGARTTIIGLSMVLAAFLVSGALTSMLTAENPQWWTIHFSSLGMGDSLSAYAFNLTLIIGGLTVAALADTIANDFAKLQTKQRPEYVNANVTTIRAILATIGILLAFVGIFPWDIHPTIHTASATGMIIIFMLLMCILPKLTPDFPRAFFVFSFSMLAAVLGCYFLWVGVGYLNLTALELLCVGTVFSWLIVFVRHISAGLEDNK